MAHIVEQIRPVDNVNELDMVVEMAKMIPRSLLLDGSNVLSQMVEIICRSLLVDGD